MDLDGQSVFFDIPLAKLGDHPKIVRIDVRKRNFNIVELRNRQDIRKKTPGKADAARTDKRYFE